MLQKKPTVQFTMIEMETSYILNLRDWLQQLLEEPYNPQKPHTAHRGLSLLNDTCGASFLEGLSLILDTAVRKI